MNPERSDPSVTPRRGIARFLRGEVTDRFLGGAAFSAAAMPITREMNHGRGEITRELNFGNEIARVTDTIPAFTHTIPNMTTTIPEVTANFGRSITAQITAITPGMPPGITRTAELFPG